MISQLIEMTKCRWREFRREPSAFFWVIFMPVLWMVLLGYAFNNSGSNQVGLYIDSGSGDINKDLLDYLANDRTISIKNEKDKIKSNIALSMSGQELQLAFDPNNPESSYGYLYVHTKIQEFFGQVSVVKINKVIIDKPRQRYIDFLIPGLMGLSIMTSSLFGTGMSLVVARRENLLKRYRATPLSPSLFFLSYINGRLMILAAEVTSILVFGYLLFRFNPLNGLFLGLVVAVLGAAAFTSLGIFCGARLKNVAAMNGIVNLMVIPMMMFGGVFFATDNLSQWQQQISSWLPLTVLVDGLRLAFLSNDLELSRIISTVIYLIAMTTIFTVLSVKYFDWQA